MTLKNNNKLFSVASLILLSTTLSFKVLADEPGEKDNQVQFGLVGDSSEKKVPVPIPNATNIGTPTQFDGQVALTNFPKLTFETQKISGRTEKIVANGTGDEVPGLRVDDVSGEGEGWNLRVKASKFLRQSDNSTELVGATLEFPKVSPVTFSNSKNKDKAPIVNKVSTSFDENARTLVSASEGSGMGAWEVAYDGDNGIHLNLPSGQLLGVYETTITYQLTVGTVVDESAK